MQYVNLQSDVHVKLPERLNSEATAPFCSAEAANVEKIVTHFLKGGATSDQLGVITPYEGQRAHVLQVMLRNGTMRQQLYTDIEVASVDSFQGREKDYIILSCVRSNEHQVSSVASCFAVLWPGVKLHQGLCYVLSALPPAPDGMPYLLSIHQEQVWCVTGLYLCCTARGLWSEDHS